jgi:hypothetical protein
MRQIMQAEGGRAVSEHEDRGVLQQYCKPCLTQTTPFRPLIICNSNSAHTTTTAGQQERRACGAYKSNHQYVPFNFQSFMHALPHQILQIIILYPYILHDFIS